MLLKIGEARIFAPADMRGDPTVQDCLEVLFYIADSNLDLAVMVADDPLSRAKAIAKFSAKFGPPGARDAAQELHGFLSLAFAEFPGSSSPVPGPATEGEGDVPHPDIWADMVDLIAHQYHWTEGFILWELPLVRLLKYEAAILRRVDPTGEAEKASGEISDDVMAGLDTLEEILAEKGITNG